VYKWELDKGDQSLEIAVNGSSILDELDLLIQSGEMAEWLKEHAWKANSQSDTEQQ
jgi:hypothetical protein